MIISIDGPAGSGKSTVAEIISKKLNIIHFNSGLLYRAVACFLLEQNFDFSLLSFDSDIPEFDLCVKLINNAQHVFVNNKDYTEHLRDNKISEYSAFVSKNKYIRQKIDNCQRSFVANNSVVIDGRDIGSFVFPNAEFKFYLDCSSKVRAQRRLLEEQSNGNNFSLEEIENQIKQRDLLDKTRKVAPLVIPNGAFIIDSTNLTIEQVVDKMLEIIAK